MNRLVKKLTKKREGALHILITSLFLILFVVVIMQLAYNNYSIQLVEDCADGALRDALLAAGTVDVDGYGAQKQVVLSDTMQVNKNDRHGSTNTVGQSKEIQDAYYEQTGRSSESILEKYLTDDAGFVKWTYPEYRQTKMLGKSQIGDNGASDGHETWRFFTNYGYDLNTKKYNNDHQKDINYLKLKEDASGGQMVNSWVSQEELDNAYLDFIKRLNSQNQCINNSVSDASNKQLAGAFDNFLTTFGWDFGIKEVTDAGTVDAMKYTNFKYSGGKLGSLTHIAYDDKAYDSQIYVDYITVFNCYKHYITDDLGRMITYPNKDSSGKYYMMVGEYRYDFDIAQNSTVAELYEVCKQNSLNGLPIYDKMIITKATLSRQDAAGTVIKQFNNMNNNHLGNNEVIIQSVDFLDPQIFDFTDNAAKAEDVQPADVGTVTIARYSDYLTNLIHQKVTVYGEANQINIRPQIGICMYNSGNAWNMYPWRQTTSLDNNYVQTGQTQGYTNVGQIQARNYPGTNTVTYQLTSDQNAAAQLRDNKSNIALFNQAVMAQFEFDVQVMGSDGQVTGPDNGVNTAYYSRIVDITIQAPESTA